MICRRVFFGVEFGGEAVDVDMLLSGDVVVVTGDIETEIAFDIAFDGFALAGFGVGDRLLQLGLEVIPTAPEVSEIAGFALVGKVVFGGEIPTETDVGRLIHGEESAVWVCFDAIVDGLVRIAVEQFVADVAYDGQDMGLEGRAEVFLGVGSFGVVGTIDEDGSFTDEVVEKMEGVDGLNGACCDVSNDRWIDSSHNNVVLKIKQKCKILLSGYNPDEMDEESF